MTIPLPIDFKDRPWYKRKWYELEILIGKRAIKTKCCESFRNPAKNFVCCKGCCLLYNSESESRWRRFLARLAKKKRPD